MRRLPIAALTVIAAAACATPTGPDAARLFESFEATDGAALSSYDRVYLAPLSASPDLLERVDDPALLTRRLRNDGGFAIDRDEITNKLADLREELREELSDVVTLVDAPGPDVLTVVVVLDELRPNRPTATALSETPALDFRSVGVGGAGVAVVLSEAGRILAVIEDDNRVVNLNDPGVGVGIWTTTDRFFERFSDKLAALLT